MKKPQKNRQPWFFVIIFFSLWLTSCSETISVITPIDISKKGKTATVRFNIISDGNFQFALLFNKGMNESEIKLRNEILGTFYRKGIPTRVWLRLTRDNNIIYNESFYSNGTAWAKNLNYKKREFRISGRFILITRLRPGNYTAELTPLTDTPELKNIETFFEVHTIADKYRAGSG